MAMPKKIKELGVCDFVALPGQGNDPILFRCTDCDITIEAPLSDSHALAHRASILRVFNSERAYGDFRRKEEARVALQSYQP